MPITQSGIRLIFLRIGKKDWGVGCTIKGAVTTGQQCGCSYRLCHSCGKPFHPISSQNFNQRPSCSRIGATRKSSASATSYLEEWNHKWNTDTEDKYSEASWYHIKSISCWLPHQVIRLQPHKTALLCGLHIHQVVDISPASPVQSCTCQKNALTWSRRGGNSKCCECCYRFAAPGDGCTIVWRLVGGWYNPTMQWLVVGTPYQWLVVGTSHKWLVVDGCYTLPIVGGWYDSPMVGGWYILQMVGGS